MNIVYTKITRTYLHKFIYYVLLYIDYDKRLYAYT